MKKALILTYYWPPAGGAGVYRWLKMSKHMKAFGWQPIIYTPSNTATATHDNSLLTDVPNYLQVIKQPIFDPLEVYTNLFTKNNKSNVGVGLLSVEKKASWKTKLLFWLRGNFFIPDPKIFWVRPSVKYLSKYLKSNPVDVIISTGPPHSLHLIGLKLSRRFGIKWLSDFRDPWTNIDFYHQLNLTKLADRENRKLEKRVLSNADLVTTVSPQWGAELQKMGANNVSILTNGYDHEEFKMTTVAAPEKFSFVHIGSMNGDRNPENLWKAFSALLNQHPEIKSDLKIELIGEVDYRVFESIKKYGLEPFLEHTNYIPHKTIAGKLIASAILLLPINNTPNLLGIIPGKLFEYIAAKRPIIAIGPINGDCANIIRETKHGVIFDYAEVTELANQLSVYYKLYQNEKLILTKTNFEKYSRKNIAMELCKELDLLIETK